MPIEQLELSSRTYNCLKRSQITKVGQILEMSEDELLALRNFGHKSLSELREKLESLGVSLESGEATDGAEPDDDLEDIRGFDDEAPRARDRYAYARVNDDEEEEQ